MEIEGRVLMSILISTSISFALTSPMRVFAEQQRLTELDSKSYSVLCIAHTYNNKPRLTPTKLTPAEPTYSFTTTSSCMEECHGISMDSHCSSRTFPAVGHTSLCYKVSQFNNFTGIQKILGKLKLSLLSQCRRDAGR